MASIKRERIKRKKNKREVVRIKERRERERKLRGGTEYKVVLQIDREKDSVTDTIK